MFFLFHFISFMSALILKSRRCEFMITVLEHSIVNKGGNSGETPLYLDTVKVFQAVVSLKKMAPISCWHEQHRNATCSEVSSVHTVRMAEEVHKIYYLLLRHPPSCGNKQIQNNAFKRYKQIQTAILNRDLHSDDYYNDVINQTNLNLIFFLYLQKKIQTMIFVISCG